MAKLTAVAVKSKPKPPAKHETNVVPSFMKGDAGKGTEKIDTADIEMPRIKLVQGIDQELIASHDGLSAGDFFHTLAEANIGAEVVIVPLHISKRVVPWAPRPPIDAGGILARADDGEHWSPADREFEVKIDKKGTKVKWKTAKTVSGSRLLEWGSYDPNDPDSPPAATLCHVVVVALPDYPELSPVLLMLQRSGIEVAKKFLGKIQTRSGTAPIFGQRYKMTSFLDNSPAGQYNNYAFAADGHVEDEDEYGHYKSLHEQFVRTGVKVREADLAAEEGGAEVEREAPTDKRTGKSRY